MMQYYDSADPYYGDGGGGGGGTGESGGEDSGITGGTDPTRPPPYKIGNNGWWEFVGGVWRWMTEPAPRTVTVK